MPQVSVLSGQHAPGSRWRGFCGCRICSHEHESGTEIDPKAVAPLPRRPSITIADVEKLGEQLARRPSIDEKLFQQQQSIMPDGEDSPEEPTFTPSQLHKSPKKSEMTEMPQEREQLSKGRSPRAPLALDETWWDGS